PEQPPPVQPMKFDPAVAAAVSVTTVPPANGAAHVAPQLMPAGTLVTVPVPVPDLVTVSVKGTGASNCALTDVAAVTATTHVPVPGQPPPLHPAKVEGAVGVAVNVTVVPG